MTVESIIKNANTFIEEIEEIVYMKDCDYVEAIVIWCDATNTEVEVAAELVKKSAALKSKVQVEAENINILKKSARLPI